ncbi:DCC1-like thiol-disulfide oxidoreductase family protein [Acuticoccus sp.]|uniref:DCC1-like thiol-disulfide oxidoreductase family protein n=1 Tax=Acuticoccus sp. TaxID=1904378 RepID=UPI003B51B320
MSEADATIVYDGECPFCSAYVKMVRLKDSVGRVELVNARDGGSLVDEIRAKGYDLDEGMVLKMNGQLYHGDDCLHRIALLSTRSGAFNRLTGVIFRSRTASKALYPFLRAGRNTTLRVLGRSKLGAGV